MWFFCLEMISLRDNLAEKKIERGLLTLSLSVFLICYYRPQYYAFLESQIFDEGSEYENLEFYIDSNVDFDVYW